MALELLLPLSVLTLNLHGYHPMGEAPRWKEHKNGAIERADSRIFYFTPEELKRGNRRRLDRLAEAVGRLQPDVVLLQEVAGGSPEQTHKSCADFESEANLESLGGNVALRLANRLRDRGSDYQVSLGCRGNHGWWTGPDSFRDFRILRGADGPKEIVFDFGANPYPSAVLIEGTAILVKRPWKIAEARSRRVDHGGGEFFFQSATLRHGEGDAPPWLVIANLHGGWNVDHFEQAVRVREELARDVGRSGERGPFLGVMIGGDFNARLFRPATSGGSAESVPWEVSVPGQFDFRLVDGAGGNASDDARAHELERLLGFVAGRAPADRARVAVTEFARMQSGWSDWLRGRDHSLRLVEALDEAVARGSCRLPSDSGGLVEPSCSTPGRIDLLFTEPRHRVRNAFVTFSGNDWRSLGGVSDHPGVFAQWELVSPAR